MTIEYGYGSTEYGPGVTIKLSGTDVAIAISAWLVANGVTTFGPRTITVNGDTCKFGEIYVDPSGSVITPQNKKMSGRGPKKRNKQ